MFDYSGPSHPSSTGDSFTYEQCHLFTQQTFLESYVPSVLGNQSRWHRLMFFLFPLGRAESSLLHGLSLAAEAGGYFVAACGLLSQRLLLSQKRRLSGCAQNTLWLWPTWAWVHSKARGVFPKPGIDICVPCIAGRILNHWTCGRSLA